MLWSISLLFVVNSFAQQDPQFTHNMFNQFSINPGFAGSMDKVCFSMLYRNQWSGIPDAPSVVVANIHTPFKLFGAEHGVGLSYTEDKTFFSTNKNANLTYAYRFKLGEGKMGIGVRGGLIFQEAKADWNYGVGIDGTQNTSENLPKSESVNLMDFSVGAYYSSELVYLGLAASHITSPTFHYVGDGSANIDLELVPNYYITAGYNYQLPSNQLITLTPSVFIQSYGQSGTQVNLNTNVTYNDRYWGGISYRINDAFSFMAGVQMRNGMKIGYAYDANVLSPIVRYSSGSHEIYFSYAFSLKKEKVLHRYKSLRFL
jgi:type IX secretion system PorP/SprF family membrane protein